MQWKSVGDFIAMGGYGFYVWGSYVLAAVLIAAEIALVVKRHRAARRNLSETVPARSGTTAPPG